MWIKELKLHNIQSYDSAHLKFSKNINVLIGANNSGKSTIIKSLYKLQVPYGISFANIRKGNNYGEVRLLFEDSRDWNFAIQNKEGDWVLPENSKHNVILRIAESNPPSHFYDAQHDEYVEFPCRTVFHLRDEKNRTLESREFKSFSQEEPNNFIYPFLSRRRTYGYEGRIDLKSSTSVSEDLRNLASKVQQLANPSHPEHENYISACKDILGFGVGLIPSANGSNIGIYASNHEFIPIETMGEGVANILGLICILHTDKNKLFLIEELENDIHPAALKKLLKLIIQKSSGNQFIVSTHSNIVAKYLGSVIGSKLFQTSWSLEKNIPTSTIHEVEETPEAKRKVLEDLGYELYDYSLWEGYLILEESSAEMIIREFLIPWFAPGLNGKLRTIAANGIGKVSPAFEDFQRLFLFTHLEPLYKNKAWVFVDGGEEGEKIIKKLKNDFSKSGWKESCFKLFSKHDFEEYYPSIFLKEVEKLLRLKGGENKQSKRDAKKILLDKVKIWAKNNDKEARRLFSKSANEVIELLQGIEKQIQKK